MAWGLINKEEVEAMFEDRRQEDRRKVDAAIAACNARHDEHKKYREEAEKNMITITDALAKLTNTLNTTNLTLGKWVELQPTVERSKNNFTTIDTLKSWGGSLAVLYVAYDIIKKIIG